MSDLSKFLNQAEADVEKLFEGAIKAAPAGDTTVSAAATATTDAVHAVIAAVPTIAATGVNALLAMVPGGSLFAAAADALIDEAITLLEARKSTPAAATAIPAAPPLSAVAAGAQPNPNPSAAEMAAA
jgi:hypothetical protein